MLTFRAKQQGPKVVILGGVHGDEPCGVEAIGYMGTILPSLLLQGEVAFEIGNPQALLLRKRFIDCNLNRLFRGDSTLTPKERASYEYTRAKVLKPLLASCDVLLDLHSVHEPNAPSFVICEPNGYDLASYLPASIVVSGFDKLHPLATDAYVNLCGGIGICLECGTHDEPSTLQRAIQGIYGILAALHMIDEQITPRTQQHLKATYIYKTRHNFMPVQSFAEFTSVTKGTLLGTDGNAPVLAPFDGLLMFVYQCEKAEQEAFVLAKHVPLR